jgi:aryl-alcohol dehydrogenase-like predicted oxidoreductase
VIPGYATPEGTAAYAKKRASAHPAHWREAFGLSLGSLGLGTYLGNADPLTDEKYAASAFRALELGVNVVDSAINYRYQRSERSIGAALKKAVEGGRVSRDQVLVCTKGGFVAGDDGPPSAAWFRDTFVKPGIASPEDIVADCHCMTPKYLRHQLDQSRRNLGVETIDVYYVHNPETQVPEVGEEDFYRRLTAAFHALEEAATEGHLRGYGTATWNAYRAGGDDAGSISLERVMECALTAGGENHHFRAIQLPFSIAMPEAFVQKSQIWRKVAMPALDAAREAGLAVFTSAPLVQGQLLGRLPPEMRTLFPGLKTDAHRCLQFARSTPGITAPLCGMKTLAHLEENAALSAVAPLTPEEFGGFFEGT